MGIEYQTIISDIAYQNKPSALFHTICHEQNNIIMLESSDVDSKENLKSLLVTKSALKITASPKTIHFTALTQNGRSLFPTIEALLSRISIIETPSDHVMTAAFSKRENGLSEEKKLLAPSIFDGLRIFINHTENHATPLVLAGLFSYELVAQFEPIDYKETQKICDDIVFYLAETLITINHENRTTSVTSYLFNRSEFNSLTNNHQDIIKKIEQFPNNRVSPSENTIEQSVSTNISDREYMDIVMKMKQRIAAGDIFQVVPARKFSLPCPSPFLAYEMLKKSNPSPYLFYMIDEDFTLFGASPESALKYNEESRQVEIYPIAGTRPRGLNDDGSINHDLDSRLELSLRTDKKELAEHFMLVDLARNDLARICEAGTRYVKDLTKVDRYAYVMHLVSRAVGTLKHDLDALHAYEASMNMGTLTGAPKVRAMQLIAEVETSSRGPYGGAVGYFTSNGDLDTCIVIRSAFVKEKIATIQAGAGIVKDSDPQAEADETRIKARAVIRAILNAHQSEEIF